MSSPEERMANRILVTKIAPEITEDELRNHFGSFGTIHDFYMPLTREQVHKGMAFMSFDEATDKELVLSAAPHTINGQEVIVDDARPRGGGQDNSEDSSVNLGNGNSGAADALDHSVGLVTGSNNNTSNDGAQNLSNTTNQWGSLASNSGGSTHASSPEPPSLGNNSFGGPDSTDRQSSANSNTNNLNGDGRDSGPGSGNNNGSGNINNNPNSAGSMSSPGSNQSSSTPLKKGGYTTSQMNEESNRVFVTRISEELTKEDLEAYFCQFGELTDIFVPLKNPNSDIKDGQHKGIAFVSFKDKDTYEEVLSRDKYEIKPNVYIVVDKAAGKEPRPGWSKSNHGKKGGGGLHGNHNGGPGGMWGGVPWGSKMNAMKGKWGGYDPWWEMAAYWGGYDGMGGKNPWAMMGGKDMFSMMNGMGMGPNGMDKWGGGKGGGGGDFGNMMGMNNSDNMGGMKGGWNNNGGKGGNINNNNNGNFNFNGLGGGPNGNNNNNDFGGSGMSNMERMLSGGGGAMGKGGNNDFFGSGDMGNGGSIWGNNNNNNNIKGKDRWTPY